MQEGLIRDLKVQPLASDGEPCLLGNTLAIDQERQQAGAQLQLGPIERHIVKEVSHQPTTNKVPQPGQWYTGHGASSRKGQRREGVLRLFEEEASVHRAPSAIEHEVLELENLIERLTGTELLGEFKVQVRARIIRAPQELNRLLAIKKLHG